MAMAGKDVKDKKKPISLTNMTERITKEDPKCWSNDILKQCLSLLRLNASGTKEELSQRVCRLKKNPELLDKLIQKHTNEFKFKSRLCKSDIPPPEAKRLSNSTCYPEVCILFYRFAFMRNKCMNSLKLNFIVLLIVRLYNSSALFI